MIKTVTITNHLGAIKKLELTNPDDSGIIIAGIDGLGPPKADINIVEFPTNDGSIYNSSRATSRNIVLTLVFLFAPTIEEVRLMTYKMFPVKKPVKIMIETGNRLCETVGYVESNEPNIFSERQATQISIICPDAYFYSAGKKQVTMFSGVDKQFEFPFSNESVTDSLIEFGKINMSTEQNIYYDGDASTGMDIYIKAMGEIENLAIHNLTTKKSMRIDSVRLADIVGSGITLGDEIVINTSIGRKSITFIREGVRTNILNALDRSAEWFQLEPGDNLFTYTADTGGSLITFRIENQTLYEGV